MADSIERQILSKLIKANDYITSRELAFSFDVSEKTILKYLNNLRSDLEKNGATLEIKHAYGSMLKIENQEKFNRYLAHHGTNAVPSTKEERKSYVLSRLMNTEDYVNVYELADELYVSPSLLRLIIKDLLKTIEQYNLSIDHSKNHGYRIVGNEDDIRRCLSKECSLTDKSNFLDQSGFKAELTNQITSIVAKTLDKFHISVSIDAIESLSLHFLIAINRNETQAADTMLREVLALSLRVSDITGGAFDVTVAPLVNAWGFGYKNGTLPDSATVDSLRALVGYRQLHLTYDGTLTKDDPRIILDCSAVAKGYGVDRVAALLHSRGVNNFMVEIGGEIVVSGNNPKGEQWRVGVNRPDDDPTSTGNAIETVLPLTDCALATSGNYRNYYVTDDGRRVSHTINPATGYPARHSLLSATVIAPTCAEADAFATAFMVMGIDSAKALLPTLPYLQVYFIYDNDGRNAVFSTIPNN